MLNIELIWTKILFLISFEMVLIFRSPVFDSLAHKIKQKKKKIIEQVYVSVFKISQLLPQ